MHFSCKLSRIVVRTSFRTLSQFFHSSARVNMSNSKTAIILLAEGAEEMEFVIAADVLRRAGVSVTVAGVAGAEPVKCSREVKIVPDKSLKDVKKESFDVVILPGGLEGSRHLSDSTDVGEILKKQEQNDKLIAAICAAPTALKSHKICLGKKLTSYPAMKCPMEEGNHYTYLEEKVVIDGNLITSRGPGTAFDFALAIVEKLFDKETASSVAKPMLLTY
ncbi:Protein dj-1beta [Gryllus bimaculatus]|nr:Protein dj-1beta [Gryllus bimaculatus]